MPLRAAVATNGFQTLASRPALGSKSAHLCASRLSNALDARLLASTRRQAFQAHANGPDLTGGILGALGAGVSVSEFELKAGISARRTPSMSSCLIIPAG